MPLTEIAASLYPWDLADEGVDRCLDNVQRRASCNSTYLVGIMHKEKRPLHARFYPHNPVRKIFIPEDSRIYWKPTPSYYSDTPIRPVTSDLELLRDTDWLDLLIRAARARGMKTGCEISHTILDEDVALTEYPEVLQKNVYGQGIPFAFAHNLVCPNNQAVREYLRALVADLVDNYDVDYVQSCLALFGPGTSPYRQRLGGRLSAGHEWARLIDAATGGCFCTACERRARDLGLDWNAMSEETRRIADVATRRTLEGVHDGELLAEADSSMSATALLLENAGFAAWLKFRVDSVTELFHMLYEEIHARRAGVEFRYNMCLVPPELFGLDYRSAFEWVDSVRESDYSDQQGTLDGIQEKWRRLTKARRSLAYEKPLLAALGVRPRATPEILRASIKRALDAGCDGLSLGHYDGATMERLNAVSDGLAAAEAVPASWDPPE